MAQSTQDTLDDEIDAALDELIEGDGDLDICGEGNKKPESEKETAEIKPPVMGPPRPPPEPVSDEAVFAKMLEDLMSQPSPSTDDPESDAFLGGLLEKMKTEFQQELKNLDSAASNSTPHATTQSDKSEKAKSKEKKATDTKLEVNEIMSNLVDDISKPVDHSSDPAKLFENMMGGSNASPDALIEDMVKELLCKDLMYEPMKQVAGRFPDWLKENAAYLDAKELEEREKQCNAFQDLVRAYETEPENQTKIMELMQQVQEFGQPPKEIIAEVAPELELDEDGMPKLGEGDCSIM